MAEVTTEDGTRIYKDWGRGQPILFQRSDVVACGVAALIMGPV